LEAPAVERLMKLMQAIISIKTATPANMYTYISLPPGSNSLFVLELR
jgi:hypothetical protein